MSGDANYSRAVKLRKIGVLVLLSYRPRDQVARRTLALRKPVDDRLPRNLPLQTNLHHRQDFRQPLLARIDRAQQAEQVVGGRVRHHLQVVRGILKHNNPP